MSDDESEIDYKKQIVELYNSEVFISLNAYYTKKSIFDILGIDRDENIHSNFLKWLLDESGSHGLGVYPLEKFLQLLMVAKDFDCNKAIEIEENLQNQYLIGDLEIEAVDVIREKKIYGDREGRIDLLLEITIKSEEGENKVLPVILENKVKTDEHDVQTENYYIWATKHYADREKYDPPMFVFLSPKYKFEVYNGDRKEICKNDAFILISYQNILDYVIEPCLKMDVTEQSRIMLNDYIRCLSYSDISKLSDDSKQKKGDYIMAISENERKLLRSFWEKNNALIMAAIQTIINDEETSDDERQNLEDAKKALENHKDFSKYSIAGDGKYGKRRLVLEVMRRFVDDHKDLSFSDYETIFPKDLQGSSGVIIKRADITKNKERNYFCKDSELLQIGNEKVAVCNQWGLENFIGFVNLINNNYPEYKILKVE